MNDFTSMRVFIQVVELRGFAAAARQLGMSTSAVSDRVSRLEASLGAQLLQRTTRQLSVTEAGARYLPRAIAITEDYEALKTEIAGLSAVPRGRLRISVPPGVGEQLVAPLAVAFLRDYPEIALELDITDRVIDLVAESYDAVIRAGPISASNLIRRKLTEIRFVVCASPDYCERTGRPFAPHDLMQHECIHWYRATGGIDWTFLKGDERVEVRVAGRLVANSVAAEREAARAGFGIANLPTFFIEEDLAAGRLVRLLEGYEPEHWPVSVLWHRAKVEPRKLRVFIDYMSRAIAAQRYDPRS